MTRQLNRMEDDMAGLCQRREELTVLEAQPRSSVSVTQELATVLLQLARSQRAHEDLKQAMIGAVQRVEAALARSQHTSSIQIFQVGFGRCRGSLCPTSHTDMCYTGCPWIAGTRTLDPELPHVRRTPGP